MTFLAPALLLLGLAVTVPLVLHLLQRHQGPRMVFPALRYLRRAERENASRIRLRQLLLLAMRILALVLLAAAAARPFLRGGGTGHEPTSVVLVLDNSLSSSAVRGDHRVLDALKQSALATLDAAEADDRFWLIRAGATWEPAVSGGAATVAEAVRETEPTAGAADLAAELERARSILAGEPADRAREIQLVSDLQATNFRRAAPGSDTVPVVTLVPDVAPTSNRGVGAVELGGGLPPRAGERSTVAAAIIGNGPDGDGDSVAVRLLLEGSVRAAAVAPVGATAVLPFPAREPGVVVGSIELEADDLAADDRRHFVAGVLPPPAVAVTQTLPFMEEALDVLSDAGRIRRAAPGAAAVILAPGAVGAEAVREGTAVVVLPPASSLELAAANQRLAAADIPWRLEAPGGGEARIANHGTELGRALAGARLREVYGLDPRGTRVDSTLLRLEGGEAWAVAGTLPEGGRYVVLATPLTPEGGTIPTSEAMLPLLDRALNAWAMESRDGTSHPPGDVVTLPAGDSLVGPDGAATPIAAGGLHRLTEAGIHRVFRDGAVIAAYAVNPPPAESDLTTVPGSRLAELLPGRDVRTATPAEWTDTIFTERLGLEISWPLLLLAALLLVAEMAVSAAGRAAQPPGARTSAAGTAGKPPVPEGAR